MWLIAAWIVIPWILWLLWRWLDMQVERRRRGFEVVVNGGDRGT
jgi:hypothetical protein